MVLGTSIPYFRCIKIKLFVSSRFTDSPKKRTKDQKDKTVDRVPNSEVQCACSKQKIELDLNLRSKSG